MSVQNESSRIQYSGNGSTETAYAVPFKFFEDTDLEVYLTDESGVDALLANGVDYTATGAGAEEGGELTTMEAYGEETLITIVRSIPATQLATYQENSRFPAATTETALDRLTMLVQQALRRIGGCLRIPTTQGSFDIVYRKPDAVICLDGNGQPVYRTKEEFSEWLNS